MDDKFKSYRRLVRAYYWHTRRRNPEYFTLHLNWCRRFLQFYESDGNEWILMPIANFCHCKCKWRSKSLILLKFSMYVVVCWEVGNVVYIPAGWPLFCLNLNYKLVPFFLALYCTLEWKTTHSNIFKNNFITAK